MENIYCIYYDDKTDEDVLDPLNMDESISFFRDFFCKNELSELSIKTLIFKSFHESSPLLCLSLTGEGEWCIDIGIYKRRKFMGPFFKKFIMKTFFESNAVNAEKYIKFFFITPPIDFISILEKNESGGVFNSEFK